jgi:hypothetical protein
VENWAGLTIVKRGDTYQRRGVVADVARTANGALLAWVQGTLSKISPGVIGSSLVGIFCSFILPT